MHSYRPTRTLATAIARPQASCGQRPSFESHAATAGCGNRMALLIATTSGRGKRRCLRHRTASNVTLPGQIVRGTGACSKVPSGAKPWHARCIARRTRSHRKPIQEIRLPLREMCDDRRMANT